MGSNRKHPFGYGMESGRIVVDPREAKLVRILFCRYDLGESLAILTDWVRQQGVPYDRDKPWNKNMIARLLADERYLGQKGYPPIITAEKFYSVADKRSHRSVPVCQTDAQKLLRQKCEKKLTADAQQQVLFLLNWLTLYPNQIQTPLTANAEPGRIGELEAVLEELLIQLPVDEQKARTQVLVLAAARYEALDSNQYETERLRRIFRQAQPAADLDAELIRKTISKVHIMKNGTVQLELKNKQIVESRNSANSI